MKRPRQPATLLTARLIVTVVTSWAALGATPLAAADPVGTSRTIVTKVLHTGDPAPGVLGATAAWVGKPQIDDSGAVAFEGFLTGPGINGSNDLILWYGHPGALQIVAREGSQVPDLPIGVVYDDWEVTYTMGADGTFAIGAILNGPGVIPGVNDKALLIGHAGQLHPVIRARDQAPLFPPGIVVTDQENYVAVLTDDGRFLTRFTLSGPGINAANNKAYWAVDSAGWHLVVRTGDQAPGCPPDVVFTWMDGVVFNPNMSIAFRGGLTGPGVSTVNNTGYWSGPPGNVQLVAREGDPAPETEAGTVIAGSGGLPTLNARGQVGLALGLAGPLVTPQNIAGLWLADGGTLRKVVRLGDPVPPLGDTVFYDTFGNLTLSNAPLGMTETRFRGNVLPSNDRAILVGPPSDLRIELREGSAIQGFSPNVVLDDRLYGIGAMNSFGDAVQAVGLAGQGVGPTNEIVLLVLDARIERWYPLMREGDSFGGHVLSIDVIQNALNFFWTYSGGSDGLRQSFDSSGQLTCTLTFSDGSRGCYLFDLPSFGDFDHDGMVDLNDFGRFLACRSQAVEGTQVPACDVFDIDWDGDIDKEDFGLFQLLIGQSR